MNPINPAEGDMIVDPSSEKTFYFTGDRWVDITSRYRDIWNEESGEEKTLLTSKKGPFITGY